MTRRGTVLVVQHEDDAPAGMLEPWLRRTGLDIDLLEAHRGRALPATLGSHAGLIVLGGHMNAYADADHRWLVPTKALIVATVAAGRPFLGICLGHQLASVALSGRVGRNAHGPTRALAPFSPTPAGRTDPLTCILADGSPVLHWNDDVVLELPAGATPLATAPDGTVQAARFGHRAWGVQFHPEVVHDVVARWAGSHRPESTTAALTLLRERQDELHRPWEKLVRQFGRLTLA